MMMVPLIASLFKVAASLCHGNSITENGFSIGNSISPDTTEDLWFVKDTILSFGGISSIPILNVLLQSSKLAYSCYNSDIEAKRHLQKEEERRKEQKLNSVKFHFINPAQSSKQVYYLKRL